MVFGTFDALHPGHLRFLEYARKFGDFLIVSISRDFVAKEIKGHLPSNSESDRKKLLEAISFVDKVVLGSKKDYLNHIIVQNPQVIVLGYDQKAFTNKLGEKLAKKGLRVKIVRARPYKKRYYQTRLLK